MRINNLFHSINLNSMKHYQATIIKYWLKERKSNFLNNVQAMILLNHSQFSKSKFFVHMHQSFLMQGLQGSNFMDLLFIIVKKMIINFMEKISYKIHKKNGPSHILMISWYFSKELKQMN